MKQKDSKRPALGLLLRKHLIKGFQKSVILKSAFHDCIQKPHHIPGFPGFSGKVQFCQLYICFGKRNCLCKLQVLLFFRYLQIQKIPVETAVGITVFIKITACNPVYGRTCRCHPARQLQHILASKHTHASLFPFVCNDSVSMKSSS